MRAAVRLVFLFPALLVAAPVTAREAAVAPVAAEPMRYVTLDRMIRTFAARAAQKQAQHAAGWAPSPATPTLVARR